MHHTNFPPGVLAAAISACATESIKLNSERIEQRFGSYGLEVLASEAGLRRSSLYSFDGDSSTCRTYAVVRFADQLDECYGREHAKILEGNSIGAIFRDNGWDIFKKTLYVGNVRLPGTPSDIARLMRLSGSHDLALHVYQLDIVRADRAFEYATIMEAHHPEYLSARALCELYEFDTAVPLPPRELNALSELLFQDNV